MACIKNISIPQPCQQDWQQMPSVDNGRHCVQCSKTVIDFTEMTNQQIFKYLSSRNQLCGKFGENQLPNFNQYLAGEKHWRKFSWKKMVFSAFIFWILSIVKTEAKFKMPAGGLIIEPIKYSNNSGVLSFEKSDTLTCKGQTAKDIKLDTEACLNGIPDPEIKVNVELTGWLGGIVVQGTVISKISDFLQWQINQIFGH